jgi:hypothetical protein
MTLTQCKTGRTLRAAFRRSEEKMRFESKLPGRDTRSHTATAPRATVSGWTTLPAPAAASCQSPWTGSRHRAAL